MNFLSHFQAYPLAINVEIKQETFAQPLKDLKKRKKSIKSESNFTNYVHHQPKFQCEYCFKGFDQSHRLKQHQISHREPTFECDQVKKIFLFKLCLRSLNSLTN